MYQGWPVRARPGSNTAEISRTHKRAPASSPEDTMTSRILLIAPEPARMGIDRALREHLTAEVTFATSCRASLSLLRREDWNLILLDENLASADAPTTEALYVSAGTAPVLEMNLAICSAERVLREVRAALSRRAQNEAKARTAAAASLGNELNASLTGVLLEAQLALRQAGPELTATLQQFIQLASELRPQLRS